MRRDGGHHIADVVAPKGAIVELQATSISLDDAQDRESFYGRRLIWLFKGDDWHKRFRFGPRGGFWWKHGSKILCHLQQPVWIDFGSTWQRYSSYPVWQVRLSLTPLDEGGERVIGYPVNKFSHREFAQMVSTL